MINRAASAMPDRACAGQARALAVAAVVGIVAYLMIDASLHYLEPQYSLLRNAESDYGNGAFGWLMDLNFVLRAGFSVAAAGAIYLTYQIDAWLRGGLALIAVWAIASGLLAFFPDDLVGHAATASGGLHLASAFIAFVAIAAGTLSAAIGLARDARARPIGPWLVAIALAGLATLPLVGRPLIRADVGLFERIFLGIELLWLLVAAGWTYRRLPRTPLGQQRAT